MAVALSDGELLARIPVLASTERAATAELVAHLAALRLRPSLYAAQGYGSLFAYCRHALQLSEDTASNRIHAARACLKFPIILDLLASGELSLSAVRILRPHLTSENHGRVLARARNARRVDLQRLVAELAPRPDVPSSVRKLPVATIVGAQSSAQIAVPPMPGARSSIDAEPSQVGATAWLPAAPIGDSIVTLSSVPSAIKAWSEGSMTRPDETSPSQVEVAALPVLAVAVLPLPVLPVSRPVVQPLSPERYRVQFTISQDAHDVLRRVQTLLRREIPDGDAGVIFERALRLLHKEVEAEQFGRPRKSGARKAAGQGTPSAGSTAYENRIRPGADAAEPASRYVPKAVKRAVWYRDRAQCAFVSASGQRCAERDFLELHHIHPYALKGPATVANIALRCRTHNAYEAEMVFGARRIPPGSG